LSYGILLTLLNIALIVHVIKTGRFMPWFYVILFLPGIGAAIYVVMELLPEWTGSRKGQIARRQIATALNPTGRYRQLVDELAMVDTIANRSALAEECLRLEKFDEALEQYSGILERPFGDEPTFALGKARAEFGLGRMADVVATLDDLKRRWPDHSSFDGHLLYARALEGVGRNDEALDNYEAVGRYYPGVEPRLRKAELLRGLGRGEEARALADDVARELTRAPAHVRRNESEWLTRARSLAKR
jgi:hypothetical protein